MQTSSKKILFINRHAPYGTVHAQEALDVLLMASAFNQEINVLFMDNGVLQLKSAQNPSLIAQKNFAKTFNAFSLYDVKNIYVEAESLAKFALSREDLMIDAKLLSEIEIGKLMQQQDAILSF